MPIINKSNTQQTSQFNRDDFQSVRSPLDDVVYISEDGETDSGDESDSFDTPSNPTDVDDTFETITDDAKILSDMEVIIKNLKEKLSISLEENVELSKTNEVLQKKIDGMESDKNKRVSTVSLNFYQNNIVGDRVLTGDADECLGKVWKRVQ